MSHRGSMHPVLYNGERTRLPGLPDGTEAHMNCCRDEMPEYVFKINTSRRQFPASTKFLSDKQAAYREALVMFGDLARDIANELQPNSEWQIEIADEVGKPIFKLTVSSESLD
jgi:hypothetical protein